MDLPTAILNLVVDLCAHGMLPVAFGIAAGSGTGLATACALVASFGTISAYTLISVGRAAQATGQYSFRALWSELISPSSAWVVEVAFAVMTFGCCIFYSAFIGDLFGSLAQATSFIPAAVSARWMVLCALAVFPLLPLCLLKNLSALQATSSGGLLSVLYTVGFVVKRSLDGSYAPGGQFFEAIEHKFRNPLKDSWGTVGLWHVGPGTVTLMNMACVAFMAHYNAVKYYEELKDRNVKRYTGAIGGGMAISFLVFAGMMLFGYKTFGPACQPLVLNNYHRTEDTLASIARFTTGCAILSGYPIMFTALKSSFYGAATEILGKFRPTQELAMRFQKDDALRTSTAVALLAVITAIATGKGEEDVAFVVGIIGSLLGSGANYIIPALLNLQLFKRQGRARGLLSEATLNKVLIAAGLAFMIVGTRSVIADEQRHKLH